MMRKEGHECNSWKHRPPRSFLIILSTYIFIIWTIQLASFFMITLLLMFLKLNSCFYFILSGGGVGVKWSPKWSLLNKPKACLVSWASSNRWAVLVFKTLSGPSPCPVDILWKEASDMIKRYAQWLVKVPPCTPRPSRWSWVNGIILLCAQTWLILFSVYLLIPSGVDRNHQTFL